MDLPSVDLPALPLPFVPFSCRTDAISSRDFMLLDKLSREHFLCSKGYPFSRALPMPIVPMPCTLLPVGMTRPRSDFNEMQLGGRWLVPS